MADVIDSRGLPQPLRCLLDSGSMSSFISLKATNRLGLNKNICSLEINGIGTMRSNANHGSVTLSIKPVGQDGPGLVTDAVILDKICDRLPSRSLESGSWTHLQNLQLADTQFYRSGQIDILIGGDLFSKVLLTGEISGKANEPDAINTIFGYVLLGKFVSPVPTQVTALFCSSFEDNLDSIVRNFLEIEAVPEAVSLSPEDSRCEEIFVEEHKRDETGRYIVSLPFRHNTPEFLGMRDMAINSFMSLERRLLRNGQTYLQYKDFMRDYLNLNHMEAVPPNEVHNASYYLPHHCVIEPVSLTTKLRVVFNASAKLPNQTSLNDHLLVGPKLQKDIATILLNFRLYPYIVCLDIKQMYRMILVNPSHCDYQRIIWRFSPDESLQDYRLKTVTYGVSSAPFLALRTISQLVVDEGKNYPLAAYALSNLTYIDDVAGCCSSLDEAFKMQEELISLLRKGGFELRKWSSNEPAVLRLLNPDHLSTDPRSFDSDSDQKPIKILGLQWNPVPDCFLFTIKVESRPCTKRTLLSELARIFDPLGFLSPVTLFTKTLIQKLWSYGLTWDQEPPSDILRVWDQYRQEFSVLSELKVPCQILPTVDCPYELHGFCDASEKGYAAVVYVRFVFDNFVTVKFVCAKTKVAPLSKLTIPRLELCAAVLLANLMSFIVGTFNHVLPCDNVYAYTDSEIVLYWIKSSAHRWKMFVSNRVAYIQERISPSFWFHVRSGDNPADIASRGTLPTKFMSNAMWFDGPQFLTDLNNSYILNQKSFDSPLSHSLSLTEEKKTVLFNQLDIPNDFFEMLLSKFTSFSLLQRIVAFIVRFVSNAKTPRSMKKSSLSSLELHDSLILLVKYSQHQSFGPALDPKDFPKPLRKLNVFIDAVGILRVGGRLKFSALPYDANHPILLSRQCKLTPMLINYYHLKYLHAGLRTLQFLLSQKFWILSPKRAIGAVLSHCLTCWKSNPKPFQPPMGDLPSTRILQAKCFLNTGVDYAGPYSLTFGRHRGVKTTKAYICLFVCMATKAAIHLELATDMTCDTFLAALQRLVSRRGTCKHLFSDQGTNFKAAFNEIRSHMEHAAAKEGIEWSFSPPSAPHFGGLWESGVKAVKSHLNRVICQQILTYEEFYTLLTLVESILNSRPLIAMSSDVEDLNALTPGHFLTMEPLSPIPAPSCHDLPLNRLSRWQLLQRLHYDFWRRWYKEYLHSLQQRSKWLKPMTIPQLGSLVLIKVDNVLPSQSPMGRIVTLHPGADGVARVAEVKTKNGILTRPLVKFCPLPIDDP